MCPPLGGVATQTRSTKRTVTTFRGLVPARCRSRGELGAAGVAGAGVGRAGTAPHAGQGGRRGGPAGRAEVGLLPVAVPHRPHSPTADSLATTAATCSVHGSDARPGLPLGRCGQPAHHLGRVLPDAGTGPAAGVGPAGERPATRRRGARPPRPPPARRRRRRRRSPADPLTTSAGVLTGAHHTSSRRTLETTRPACGSASTSSSSSVDDVVGVLAPAVRLEANGSSSPSSGDRWPGRCLGQCAVGLDAEQPEPLAVRRPGTRCTIGFMLSVRGSVAPSCPNRSWMPRSQPRQ